jgi:hypothetical protein
MKDTHRPINAKLAPKRGYDYTKSRKVMDGSVPSRFCKA